MRRRSIACRVAIIVRRAFVLAGKRGGRRHRPSRVRACRKEGRSPSSSVARSCLQDRGEVAVIVIVRRAFVLVGKRGGRRHRASRVRRRFTAVAMRRRSIACCVLLTDASEAGGGGFGSSSSSLSSSDGWGKPKTTG
jgi:hypothetical protein